MSDPASNTHARILHIRRESWRDESTDNVETWLAAMPVDVERCSDVYRGLARLGAAEAGTWQTVIVCVDGFGPDEQEFFSLASRVGRDVDVYVYGGVRSSARVARAIELGAEGQATEALIQSLVPTAEPSNVEAILSQDSPPDALPDPPVASAEVEEEVRQSEKRVEAVPEPRETVEESPAIDVKHEAVGPTPRVPWLSYKDRPTRTGPGAGPQSTEGSASENRSPRRRGPSPEPLLTEEELRALVGDDIAATVPDPRDGDGSDGSGDPS